MALAQITYEVDVPDGLEGDKLLYAADDAVVDTVENDTDPNIVRVEYVGK